MKSGSIWINSNGELCYVDEDGDIRCGDVQEIQFAKDEIEAEPFTMRVTDDGVLIIEEADEINFRNNLTVSQGNDVGQAVVDAQGASEPAYFTDDYGVYMASPNFTEYFKSQGRDDFISKYGFRSRNSKFTYAIDTSLNDDIYTIGLNEVVAYTDRWTQDRSVSTDYINGVADIAIDDTNAYVLISNNSTSTTTVTAYDKASLTSQWTQTIVSSERDNGGISVGPNGRIFAAASDSSGANEIHKLDSSGNQLGSISQSETFDGLTVHPNGKVYSLDMSNYLLEISNDMSGIFKHNVGIYPYDNSPNRLDITPNGNVIACGEQGYIKFNPDTENITTKDKSFNIYAIVTTPEAIYAFEEEDGGTQIGHIIKMDFNFNVIYINRGTLAMEIYNVASEIGRRGYFDSQW